MKDAAYRSSRLHGCSDYGIPASTLPVLTITYCCLAEAVSQAVTLLFYTLFPFHTPIASFLSDNLGACSAARHSPGELRSTKRLDLSSDGRSLRLPDTMRPSDRH